jgi:alpha-beta hydrolase superfamily lysophospholipase
MEAPPAPVSRHWTHPASDGAGLFVCSSEPAAGPTRGCVLITPGLGEHSGRYTHVMQRLSGAGYRVLAWDLRGHGRSDGRRGDVRDYSLLIDDLRQIWSLASPGPRFLYGHSLGGQITLNFAARHRPSAAGLVITSPWLRLSFAPSRAKLLAASVAARIWPTFSQNTNLVSAMLSRDLDFLKTLPDLHLVHHRVSARMYHALTAGARQAARDAGQLPYPILLLHGGSDPVTSPSATEELYRSLGSTDKSLIIIPHALHEIHNDLCRDSVLSHIVTWLDARAPARF